MLVRGNCDGTYCATWTPAATGCFSIIVTIDGYDLEEVSCTSLKTLIKHILRKHFTPKEILHLHSYVKISKHVKRLLSILYSVSGKQTCGIPMCFSLFSFSLYINWIYRYWHYSWFLWESLKSKKPSWTKWTNILKTATVWFVSAVCSKNLETAEENKQL